MPNVSVLSGDYLASGSYFEILGTGLVPNLVSLDQLTQPTSVTFHGRGTPVTGLQVNLSFQGNQEDLRKHYNSQYWTLFTGSTAVGPFLEFRGNNKNQYQSTGIIISSGAWLPGAVPGTNFFTKIKLQPLSVRQRIETLENSGAFALNSNQKIGIGISNPFTTEKLHVNGNVRVDGNLLSNKTFSGVSLNVSNVSATNITGSNLITGFILRGGAGNNIIRGVDTYGATILAGSNNLNTGTFGFLGGGYANEVLADSAALVGGGYNTNRAKFGFIGGGFGNNITGEGTGIGVSPSNGVTIVGGVNNLAKGTFTSIVGGSSNSIDGDSAVLVGGINNKLTGVFSTIVGGGFNLITGNAAVADKTCYSVIVGGENNVLIGAQSYIGAGLGNFASGSSVVIGGGSFNQNLSWNNTIGGGYQNRIASTGWGAEGSIRKSLNIETSPNPDKQWWASNAYNTIGGGTYNSAFGNSNTIAGGWENWLDGVGNVIAGGWENMQSGYTQFYSNILGGYENKLSATKPGPKFSNGANKYTGIWDSWGTGNSYAIGNSILGGRENTIIDGKWNTIINGYRASIIDGNRNVLQGSNSIIGKDGTGNFAFGVNVHLHSGYDQLGQNALAPSNAFVFGNDQSILESNVVSFSDQSSSVIVALPNAFYLNYLNGLILKSSISLTTNSKNDLNQWWNHGPNSPKGLDHYGVGVYLRHIFSDLTSPASAQSLTSVRDISGNLVTGYKANINSYKNITIGDTNFSYAGRLVNSYNKLPLYGNATLETGIGILELNENVILGNQNYVSVYDVVLGNRNKHIYQTGDHMIADKYVKKDTQTDTLPSAQDAYSVLVGWKNYVSGFVMMSMGKDNRVHFDRSLSTVIGNYNQVHPLGLLSGVIAEVNDPYGVSYDYYLGYQRDPNYIGGEAKGGNIVIGNQNDANVAASLALGDSLMIGNYNRSLGLSQSLLIGASNFASGNGHSIIGTTNQAWNEKSKIFGRKNNTYLGNGHIMIGGNQNIYGMDPLLNVDNHTVIGYENALAASRNSIVLGNSNFTYPAPRLQEYTLIGNNNHIENFGEVSGSINNVIIGNNNFLDGKDTINIGGANFIYQVKNSMSLGNLAVVRADSAISIGNQNLVKTEAKSSMALGNGASTYNIGQVSVSNIDASYLNDPSTVYAAGGGGMSQRSSLVWRGITNSSARQEIYLNNLAYDPIRNEATRTNGGVTGRAYIPSGRLWNGTMTITAVETGFKNIRTITQTFLVGNTGWYSATPKNNIAMNMLNRQTISDRLIGTDFALNNIGVMFSGDHVNDKLGVWVTGLANRKILWNIKAEFEDIWVPTKEDIYMINSYSGQYGEPVEVPVI
jgi:hypothetical protein